MSDPLDRKLLFVVGKGGVGRTSVAITLALAAGLRGKRAAVIELYGNDQVPDRFDLPGRSFLPQPIAPGVDTLSLTPYECLDDFGKKKLKVSALVRVLFHNRVFHAFVDAVPGLHDLFQLGKLNHLVTTPDSGDPQYDLVIVDAPATGHGLTLLASARSMGDMVGSGLVSEESAMIAELLEDPERTGLVLVTLPDELPVNESLELVDQLGERRDLLAGFVVNQVRDLDVPDEADWDALASALRDRGDEALARLGDSLVHAADHQQDAVRRMRVEGPEHAGFDVPTWEIPRIEPRELTKADLPELAKVLSRQMEGSP